VWITLNGDRTEIAMAADVADVAPGGTPTVTDLLTHLQIDPRRVAVELNLVVLKRDAFGSTALREGDEVEIVNFVGGG
jgi:sulfur carrier protein